MKTKANQLSEYEILIKLSKKNEVRVDNHKNYKRTPPFYYDSLRHAMSAYFNTFHSHNAMYDFYAQGYILSKSKGYIGHNLDEDNTVLGIIGFERFFELFLKDILTKTNINLVLQAKEDNRNLSIDSLITQVETKSFIPKKNNDKTLSIPFQQTIKRFYKLIELVKNGNTDSKILRKFSNILKKYSFLESSSYEATFKLVNWYRDRILHNGSELPSLWLLDYIVTQRCVPIITDIIAAEKKILGESMFYFTTVTGINVLEELNKIKFEFDSLNNQDKIGDVYAILLKIGHLKELGRANLNMNYFVRNYNHAGYEYNYRDPIGRGKRFAEAEKGSSTNQGHPHFKRIAVCPCCGENSMVVYCETVQDPFSNPSKKENITWVKCYTCDYHLRFNVGEPIVFGLHSELIFETK